MPQSKQIFYDANRKRWRRLRLVLDASVIVITLLVVFFVVSVIRGSSVPGLALPDVKRPYHALKDNQKRKPARRPNTHRKTKTPASQVVLNSDEGIRGAFYVQWDAASFASLKEYYPQIDLLFPEWMHVLTADGRLQAVTEDNILFDVMDEKGKPRPVDDKVMPFLKGEKAQMEVLPLVNNFDPVTNEWRPEVTAKFMADPAARQRFRSELARFLATDQYKGITLDIEAFPESSRADYRQLVQELYDDLHAKGMKLYIAVPVNDRTFDYSAIAKISDGLILMNYDQHYPGGDPGPVAGQDWFLKNLQDALKVIPKDKIICAVGNYGYDWAMKKGQKKGTPPEAIHNVSVQEAWLEAEDAETDVNFDDDAMNPHFAYLDENNVRHDVWYLDGVTALNQMRGAHALGIDTFALWRLGSEDRSLWAVWDKPFEANAPQKLDTVPPGQDVDIEGQGEILRIEAKPAAGRARDHRRCRDQSHQRRDLQEHALAVRGRHVRRHAAKKVAITFDDGPDPQWTPKILDVLKEKGVKATFFLIGVEAEKYPGIAKRIYDEGHEIGNHTFTHPDISNISKRYFEVGAEPHRAPLRRQAGREAGAVPAAVLDRPGARHRRPGASAGTGAGPGLHHRGRQDRSQRLARQSAAHRPKRSPTMCWPTCRPAQPSNLRCGNIILLHDGGGDRSETVKALPHDHRRAAGRAAIRWCRSPSCMGKTRADVMPPLTTNERWAAWVDSLSFSMFGLRLRVHHLRFLRRRRADERTPGAGGRVGHLRPLPPAQDAASIRNYRPAVAVLIPGLQRREGHRAHGARGARLRLSKPARHRD